jgi:hypothetical protein
MIWLGILIGLAFPLVGYAVEQCTWAAEKYSWEHLFNWYTWPIIPFAILYQKYRRKRQH